MYSSDDTTMYYVSKSIVEEFNTDLQLDSISPNTFGLISARFGTNYRLYSSYPILQPLLAVPLFIIGNFFASLHI